MSRLEIPMPNKAQVVVEQLYKDLEEELRQVHLDSAP